VCKPVKRKEKKRNNFWDSIHSWTIRGSFSFPNIETIIYRPKSCVIIGRADSLVSKLRIDFSFFLVTLQLILPHFRNKIFSWLINNMAEKNLPK
jgi:hypothetical protein